jgi:hypothetical protein
MEVRSSVASVVRSVLAVVLGYAVIAAGTILTFNLIVGQISVASPPSQLLAGTPVYLKATDLESALRSHCDARALSLVDIFSDSVVSPWRSTLRTS